jgi:hypothetical protein
MPAAKVELLDCEPSAQIAFAFKCEQLIRISELSAEFVEFAHKEAHSDETTLF